MRPQLERLVERSLRRRKQLQKRARCGPWKVPSLDINGLGKDLNLPIPVCPGIVQRVCFITLLLVFYILVFSIVGVRGRL